MNRRPCWAPLRPALGRDRGAVELVDALLGFILLVAVVVTAPLWVKFTALAAGSVDPFSSLLLQLTVPLLLLALVVGAGVAVSE